jgi:hypothetical protein
LACSDTERFCLGLSLGILCVGAFIVLFILLHRVDFHTLRCLGQCFIQLIEYYSLEILNFQDRLNLILPFSFFNRPKLQLRMYYQCLSHFLHFWSFLLNNYHLHHPKEFVGDQIFDESLKLLIIYFFFLHLVLVCDKILFLQLHFYAFLSNFLHLLKVLLPFFHN